MSKKKTTTSNIKQEVSLESQARLMQIMNDSPTIAKLSNTEWEITALKPGTMHLIAQEACAIQFDENNSEKNGYVDALKFIGSSMDRCVRVITLALLNDEKRIREEYDTVYNTIKWESNLKDWAKLLAEILQLIDTNFFFATTNAIQMFRTMTSMRKMTKAEAESLSQGQSLGK